jgi:hypothetical protein
MLEDYRGVILLQDKKWIQSKYNGIAVREVRLIPELFDVAAEFGTINNRSRDKVGLGTRTFVYPGHIPPTSPATWDRLCARTPPQQLSLPHAPSRLEVPSTLEDSDYMSLLMEGSVASGVGLDVQRCHYN